MNAALWATVSGLALFTSSMVMAQGAPASASAQTDETPLAGRAGAPPPLTPHRVGSDSTPAQDSASAVVGEVIVTAQRRSESIQKTGLAIEAVSASQLVRSDIVNIAELTKLVPSVQMTNAGHAQLFYIRGIGSLTGNSLGDPSIAVSLGGVFVARPYQIEGSFYDLERVEVLNGPQGTLYGRNATGGAVNIIPKLPSFSNSVDLGFEIGDYDLHRETAAANLALSDKVAVRGSMQISDRSGYLSDGTDDDHSRSGRLQLMYKPVDHLSILLAGDFNHLGGKGPGGAEISDFNINDRVGSADPRVLPLYAANGQVALQRKNDVNDDVYGLSATVNYDTDFGTFTLIPAYRHANINFDFSSTGFDYYDRERDRQYSIEARFASDSRGRLHYIIGGYYLNDAARQDTVVGAGFPVPIGLGQTSIFDAATRAYAAFADATFTVFHGFRLIGGARYTDEQKGAVGTDVSDNGIVQPPLNATKTKAKVTYRAGVEADLARDSLLYATVATGFHSGGFFFTSDNPTYKPEEITAYTLGVKNRFLDRRLVFNVEAFRWDFSNQQFSHITFDSVGEAVFITENVGMTRIQGVETELQAQATATTLVGAQVQYLDSKYLQYSYKEPIIPPTTTCPVATSFAPPFPVYTVNCSGRRPPQSPEWSLNLNGEQRFPFADGSSLAFDVQSHFQTLTLTGVEYLPGEYQPAYWTTDLSLTYSFAQNRYSVTGFVNNVSNTTVRSNAFPDQFTHIFLPGPAILMAELRPPRTFGVRFNAHF